MDAVYAWQTALVNIGPEDHTPLIVTKVIHKFRCLASSGLHQDALKNALMKFIDTIMQKSAVRGKRKTTPLSFQEVER